MDSRVKIALALLVIGIVAAAGVYTATIWKPGASEELSSVERVQMLEGRVADLIKTNDPIECEKAKDINIGSVSYQTVCEGNIYMNLAEQKGDVSYCDKLDNELFPIDLCKSNIITQKVHGATSPIIFDSAGSQELKDSCLFQYWSKAAVDGNDASVCAKVPIPRGVGVCKDSVYIEQISEGKKVDCSNFSKDGEQDCKSYYTIISSKPASNAACVTLANPILQSLCNKNIQ